MPTHIFTKTLEVQMLHLVHQPLVHLASHASAPGFALPYVFIIDGLDQCLDQVEQEAIIRLFTSILRRNIGWKVLITSQREQAVRSSFNLFDSVSLSSHIALSNDHDSDGDVRRFLEDKLTEIKHWHTHFRKCYIPTGWPFLSDINQLVQKSSGQFTYAVNIIRYVSFKYGDPVDRLHSILDNELGPMPCRVPEAQPPATDLYMSILISSPFSVF